MIGRLTGVLVEKKPPYLLLDVHGVGYELEAPMSTFYALPENGAQVTLHTHWVAREDAQLLYAFYSQPERQFFRELIKVNGVGPKMALGILAGMDWATFATCVRNQDFARLTHLPGVGRKTAERLVLEMRGKLDSLTGADLPAVSATDMPIASVLEDAIGALVSLGYKRPEAEKLARAAHTEGITSEQLIRKALQAAV